MPRHFLLKFFVFAGLILLAQDLHAEGLVASPTHFYYRNSDGRMTQARIIRHYFVPVVHASASVDPRLSPLLRRAVSIAEERASAHTKGRCWQYVKEALVAAGAVPSYPKTTYACDAGEELVRDFGFKRLPIHDPYAAPLGAVLVYGRGSSGKGHVELRAKNGFVSDYRSKWKCYYPLLAVYGKFS
ncbi:MAG: hypothetical protein ACXWHF_01455 [Chthoniobacterales bacterium]